MLQNLRGKADTLFIEKPIFERTDRALADCLAPGQKAYVAAPMRWCGTMLALKKALPALSVVFGPGACARPTCPDWRPGVDYRTVYSAHKDMGGGVTIDLIHEWDYLVELFGKPEKMYNFKGTYSHLEIDSDDLSVYIARYPTLLCEVHLDYFGRDIPAQHRTLVQERHGHGGFRCGHADAGGRHGAELRRACERALSAGDGLFSGLRPKRRGPQREHARDRA